MAEGFWNEDYNFGNGFNSLDAPEANMGYGAGGQGYIPYQTPGDTGGGGWGGFKSLGMDLAKSTLPNVLGAAAGYGINALMPGKTSLVDTRNPQQKQLAQSGMSSLSNLNNNPNSFGLPGDPEDVNSQAGRKLYGIRQQNRSADAARGMFSTGGSVQRENNAVTDASNNAFAQLQQTYGQQAGQGAGMTMKSADNPWAKLLAGIASPAVQGISSGIMKNFGLA
jgi:hypothetical protein